jgi:alanine dehydrogenase
VLLSFIEEVAEAGEQAFRENATLRKGVYLYDGACTHDGLASLLDWEYRPLDEVVPAAGGAHRR